MKNKYILLLLYFLFNTNLQLTAQENQLPTLSNDAVFSLITCTPGHDLYNQFGHSAIRLRDPNIGLDFVYNYGTFDFDTPNFVMKFIERKLMYTLSKSYFKPFLNVYVQEGRGVSEQIIALDSVQRQKLFEILEINYLPKNREYLYDFFYDNCATKIRDVFGSVGDLKIENSKSQKTFRAFLDEYLYMDPWLNFGIDLILGLEADKVCNSKMQMFLPDYLSYNLEKSSLNGKSLLEQTKWILPKPEKNINRHVFTPFLCFLIVFSFSLLLIFLKNKSFFKIWEITVYILLSFAGLFLLFMWLGTDHIATQKNLNILWANPLYVLWIFSASRKKLGSFARYAGYFLLLANSAVLFMFFVPIQEFNVAVLPFVFFTSFTLSRVLFNNSSINDI